MRLSKLYYVFILLFVLPLLLLQNSGCEKEYSYEGGDTVTITTVRDTLPIIDSMRSVAVSEFPACALCNASADIALGTWSFKTGNSYLCGTVTNPGFIGGNSKTDFTVFGPSACSNDTGLVLSVYLPLPLDQDRYNLTTSAAAFYYYNNTASKDILISQQSVPFSVTVQSFITATSIATGTFSGIVFKANGDTAFITEGRFLVKLK